MTTEPPLDTEMERLIQLQVLEHEQANLKSRIPTRAQREKRGLLARIVLTFDVLSKAGIEADGNNTKEKLEAAIKKITSTPEGVDWVKERLKSFPR